VAEEVSSAGERVGGWWGSMDLVGDGQGGLAGRGPWQRRGPMAVRLLSRFKRHSRGRPNPDGRLVHTKKLTLKIVFKKLE
jgi:hypothetical protein